MGGAPVLHLVKRPVSQGQAFARKRHRRGVDARHPQSVFRVQKKRAALSGDWRGVRHPEKGFDIAYYGDPKMVGWGGGLPVVMEGVVVGAVGVSGMPQEVNMELAQMGVEAIQAMNQ